MAGNICDTTVIFGTDTKTHLLHRIRSNPNSRLISLEDRQAIIDWLIDNGKCPSNQKEFSRRNYVRKITDWDEETQILWTKGESQDQRRLVATEESISGVIEAIRIQDCHQGWDTTWKDVSSKYYGVLRAELILLLKHCRVCAQDPKTQPKHGRSSPSLALSDSKPKDGPRSNAFDGEVSTDEYDMVC